MDSEKEELGEYIGDGVYVSHDGFQFWLKTFDGYEIHDRIALEPDVLRNLNRYVQRLTSNPE